VTRAHRIAHRALWPVLAVLVGLGFAAALHLRPPPDAPPFPEATSVQMPRGAGTPP